MNVGDKPNIESLDNAIIMNYQAGQVAFLIEQLDENATMKFTTGTSESSLYPINVQFNTANTLLGLEINEAIDLNTKAPVSFKVTHSLTTEQFELTYK